MHYVYLAILFLLGVLGAANLIIARKPEAKELIAKLAPIQGWLGVAGFGLGVWWLVQSIINGWFGVLHLITIAVYIALGLLLGIGVLKTFIKKEEVTAKLDACVVKLSPYQGILGLVAIGLAVWALIQILTA